MLADPWDNHDEYVNVVLGSPAGGASIGPQGTSLLRIIDVDPNQTPPEVSGLTLDRLVTVDHQLERQLHRAA